MDTRITCVTLLCRKSALTEIL